MVQKEDQTSMQLSKSFIPQIQRTSITPRFDHQSNANKWEQLYQMAAGNSKTFKRDLNDDEVLVNRETQEYTFKPDLKKSFRAK